MKRRIVLSTTLILSAIVVYLHCTHVNTAGNGSDIGNPTLVGMLYENDGFTPAAGVKVVIRPRTTLADTAGAGLTKRMNAVDSVVTDSAGRFAFDSTLDTGNYVIEAMNGNDAVLIDSVVVNNRTLTDSLPPDTLKPAGALKGVIKLSEGGDPRKVFVLAFGIDRFARVEVDGRFKFSALAEAVYDLRIISSLDNYGVLDTVNIPVISADTTDLDTIDLPFTGIPTPKNVTIFYDTLKQIVTLTWDKADTALVGGYNVYRRNVDSNTVAARINTSPITDTMYRDSTGIQDQTYEYKVTALDKQGNEGKLGSGVSVKVTPVFSLLDSVNVVQQGYTGQSRYLYGMAVSADTRFIYTCNPDLKRIYKVDITSKTVTNEWTIPDSLGSPWDIVNQNDTTLLFCSMERIVQISNQGTIIKSWRTTGNLKIKKLAYDSGFAYFIQGNLAYDSISKISRINVENDTLETVLNIGSGKDFYALNIGKNSLWVAYRDYTSGVPLSDSLFIAKSGYSERQLVPVNRLDFNRNQNPYFAFCNAGVVLSTHATARLISAETNQILAQWSLPEVINCAGGTDDILFFAGTNGKIYLYGR